MMKKFLKLIFLIPAIVLGQSVGQNYIKIVTYKVPTQIVPHPTAEQLKTDIVYYDGFGKPIQNVAYKQAGDGTNLTTHIEYDEFGRQVFDYLPYPGGNSLDFDNNLLQETLNYGEYLNQNPMGEKLYESSPLNRLIKQSGPGISWKLHKSDDLDHNIKYSYDANTNNDKVKWYKAETTWKPYLELFDIYLATGSSDTYPAGELYKKVTKDENWVSGNSNTVEEYRDKEGKLVLRRCYKNVETYDTYYVYDVYGNLTYVIPPKVDTTIPLDSEILNELCFQYKYDARNRLVEKKLPGKQWEFIIYDNLDRPVATGPAFNPRDGQHEGWLITKYDAFGRVAYTGWKEGTVTALNRMAMQQDSSHSPLAYESRTTSPVTIGDLENVYYTNDSFVTDIYPLSVNYYDDYNFPGGPSNSDLSQQVFGQSQLAKHQGLLTGTWQRVLLEEGFTPLAETAYTLYDLKARPIRVRKTNHLGGYTLNDTKFDFLGKPISTFTKHRYNPSASPISVKEEFAYNDQDRLLTHTHQVNSEPVELLSFNQYDPLGKLIQKNVGGTDLNTFGGFQHVNYTYNIRGWLTGINKIDDILQTNDLSDLFAFRINYDSVSGYISNIDPLYNGNISETFWRTSSDNIKRQYGYQYDDLNRLVDAIYMKPDMGVINNYNESLSYDKNGNIKTLKRFGGLDSQVQTYQIDNLYYSYANNSNRLMRVADTTNSPLGFDDDSSGIDHQDDYNYDLNGNLIRDDNKNISAVSYNHLNLPVTIQFSSGNSINYVYNSMGEKVRKMIITPTETTTVAYLDDFQYKDGILQFFKTSEGYVNYVKSDDASGDQPAGWYNYVYNYLDHLGNVRLSYGLDPQTQTLKILQENHYYPFGLKHTDYNTTVNIYDKGYDGVVIKPAPPFMKTSYDYKYNGKEWQDELDFNLYNYGFRNYDPAIGRWINVDPLAERRFDSSTYSYCLNNPVLRFDPNGLTDFTFDKKTGDVKQIGEASDKPDRILRTNRKGEVKYGRNGKAKVAVDGIEQGILKDGQNFRNSDQVINVGGEGQPSVEGVKSFALQLSEYLGKEIKGFSYSSDRSGKVTDIVLGKYKNNSLTESFGTTIALQLKYGNNFSFNNVLQQFHTHPNGELGATQSAPYLSADVKNLQKDKVFIPNSSFIILYRVYGDKIPAEYDYTREYVNKKK